MTEQTVSQPDLKIVSTAAKAKWHGDIDNYEGICPRCRIPEHARMLNVHRDQYILCERCNVHWWVGMNVYSGWRKEGENIWRQNRARLERSDEVECLIQPGRQGQEFFLSGIRINLMGMRSPDLNSAILWLHDSVAEIITEWKRLEAVGEWELIGKLKPSDDPERQRRIESGVIPF